MSYSNGKLPEDTYSHEKVIEIVKGLPGVGFKLTDDGDYDIQNKKLRNLDSPQTNDDATTKSYVDKEVSGCLKIDGSNAMTGALNMDNRRVENIAPARHGQSDAVSSLHLHSFYFELNTNDGKIEAQNPIDMKNKRISGVQDPILHSDASNKFYVDSSLNFKADKTELANYLKKDGSISVTGNFDFGNNKISNLAEGTGNSDAVTKHQLQTGLSTKPNTNQVVLRDGSQDMTGNLNMSQKKIVNLANPTGRNDATGKGYVDRLFLDSLRLDGSAKMTGNLDMNNNKLINLADPTGVNDATGKGYVDRLFLDALRLDGSAKMTGNLDMNNKRIINIADPTGNTDAVNKRYLETHTTNLNLPDYLKKDGSVILTGNLNMNNQRIINLGRATHNQDAITLKQVNDAFSTISTANNRYTDEQIEKNKKYVDDEIVKSHITTHTNRENVLKYAMADGEFTEDYGIQDANLIDYNDSPHKNNKKAFSFNVQKAADGSSLFKGRFDFNLFKLIRDNYSDKYTVCLEIYFLRTGFDVEFNSFQVTFEQRNMNTDRTTTVKTNTDYKYYRFIMNLSPDGSSPTIERRLYVTVQSTYDNRSPTLLPLYVLIYGIKGEAKNNLDFTIYDYELAYEIVNDQFQMHVPINMNGNKILGLFDKILPSYAYGTTSESSLGCDFNISRTVHLTFTKIYIDKIKIYAKKNYPSESNHDITFYGDASVFYDIDFSTSKILTVNINRYFENITNIRINFDDDDGDGVRSYVYMIHYKTLLIN